MAEDKYANAKCFVLSQDGYEEITYSELCRRRDTDETYKNKKFIPLHGMLMEVMPEQYIDFYRTKNRQRYLDKRSIEKGDISIDMLTTPEFNGENILASEENVEDQVIKQVMLDKLRACLSMLTEEEMELIHFLFYKEKSETELSSFYGISQQAISKRLKRTYQAEKTSGNLKFPVVEPLTFHHGK